MKTIWTSFRRYKSLFLFLFILFLFGVVTGILFYFKQDVTVRSVIVESLQGLFQENVFAFKNIFYHAAFLLIVVALLFCFFGLPLQIIFLFFEGISIGFILPIFVSLYKIHSVLYFAAYFLFIKSVYLILLFFLFAKTLHFTKNYIYGLKNKKTVFLQDMKYVLFLLFVLVLNDFVVYFVSNPLLIFLLGK